MENTGNNRQFPKNISYNGCNKYTNMNIPGEKKNTKTFKDCSDSLIDNSKSYSFEYIDFENEILDKIYNKKNIQNKLDEKRKINTCEKIEHTNYHLIYTKNNKNLTDSNNTNPINNNIKLINNKEKNGNFVKYKRYSIKYITDPARRRVTFSKRKNNIFKKLNNLSQETGAKYMCIVQKGLYSYIVSSKCFDDVVDGYIENVEDYLYKNNNVRTKDSIEDIQDVDINQNLNINEIGVVYNNNDNKNNNQLIQDELNEPQINSGDHDGNRLISTSTYDKDGNLLDIIYNIKPDNIEP